ncbi:DUF4936 family protein [Paucibacter sediminis]|uniref:DUF4936 family protein n=1 Tax=Paucibacter sediminis TaxID=3019553 RepID=A0AA95SPQ5_9BURK|nr:DUF4936 family protein [Paucibacter sp. S2-9]WIT11106.1 DUF4936 family protein [Paucibacter sp. S2-9]
MYYRLVAERAPEAWHAFLAARGDEPVRLLQRQDSDGARLTWMEIYGPSLHDGPGLEQKIAAAMAPFIDGDRHAEIFSALQGDH